MKQHKILNFVFLILRLHVGTFTSIKQKIFLIIKSLPPKIIQSTLVPILGSSPRVAFPSPFEDLTNSLILDGKHQELKILKGINSPPLLEPCAEKTREPIISQDNFVLDARNKSNTSVYSKAFIQHKSHKT